MAEDPATLRAAALRDAGVRAQADESAQRRALAAMQEHLLQPATVHAVEVHGARNTRRTLLDPVLRPLVDDARNAGTTLGDVLADVQAAVGKLERFAPTVHLADARQRDPAAAATDVDVAVRVAELPRLRLSTGTDLGNTEGAAYGSLLWRNILGGAETLAVSASAGTRTRAAYSAVLAAPLVPGHPDVRLALEGLASTAAKPWASHDEALRAATLRLAWRDPASADAHSLAYAAAWRQLTGAPAASPTVRRDAGDSLKSSLAHTFVRDRRDRPLLPRRGYLVRTAAELAGWGPLGGDVAFAKTEAELAAAAPLPLGSATLTASLRAGLLCPLVPGAYALSTVGAPPSRVTDRFQLGGPADVRGFAVGGLGPHDGADAVGGDLYAAAGLGLLLPLPRTAADSPLRLQLFANSGRLVAVKPSSSPPSSSTSSASPSASPPSPLLAAARDLANGLPSTAVGVGLVYAHPVARFELNFSLPLVLRRGEESRKGLQVGVGINFL